MTRDLISRESTVLTSQMVSSNLQEPEEWPSHTTCYTVTTQLGPATIGERENTRRGRIELEVLKVAN